MDLYPRQFDESYPLPSFNTRDLDTVDDGCLDKLPLLLKDLRMNGTGPKELEVIISHFLGVDHVGHTYGPHDKHMAEKLQQMDIALSTTLDVLDTSQKCHLAVIFGGMSTTSNHFREHFSVHVLKILLNLSFLVYLNLTVIRRVFM